MQTTEALARYFLTGTAEEDRPFLDRAFITHEQLSTILSMDPGAMRILAGSKGIGKTALFEWLAKVASRRQLPVLLLRPDDLDTKSIPVASDIATLKRGFYESVVTSVAVALGRQLRGFLKGDAAKLYDVAMGQGARDPDFVGKVLQLLSAVSVPVSNVNGVQLAKDLAGKPNPDAVVRSVTQHLLAKGSILFLLIDDTDQVAAPSDASQLNRIWALLLAVRRLSGECPQLRCIVSLRTEIWARLESESEGQRDQTDHLRGLVIPLRASDDLMHKILLRRLTLAAEDLGKPNTDPYTIFFEKPTVRLPTSEELRPWEQFILKSARERPRDAIQLIKILADKAKLHNRAQIGDLEADEGMKQYSKERVKDAADEYSKDCDSVRRIFQTFSKGDFELSFEALRMHLRTVGSGFSLVIRGETIKPDDDDDALRLLRFLHEIGFINPRLSDSRKPKDFRHVTFNDDPYFVQRANWNTLQAARWEIHPAFRSFLIGEQADKLARQ
jgi:hypothetical protein